MDEKVKFCLSDDIKKIVRQAREKGDVSQLIDNLKTRLEDILKKFDKSDDLRVFDNKEGGVLRGPIDSRKKKEMKGRLLCDMKQTPDKEVPFMRALFNNRLLGKYSTVAYETPFMRKKSKARNSEYSNRIVSCDLLGISSNELCCIEIKTNPEPDTTWLPYGLAEAFAYGVCLSWLTRNRGSDLCEELNLCRESFLGLDRSIDLPNIVSFALAAPLERYFKKYLYDPSDEMRVHGKVWCDRRVRETKVIENAIEKYNSASFKFAGYISIHELAVSMEKSSKEGLVTPVLKETKNRGTTYPSFDMLLKGIRK